MANEFQRDVPTGHLLYDPVTGHLANECGGAGVCPISVTVTLSGFTNGTFSPCIENDNINAAFPLAQILDCTGMQRCLGGSGAADCCYSVNYAVYQSPEFLSLCYDIDDGKWYLWIVDSCCLDIKAELAGADAYSPAGVYTVTSTTCVTVTGTIVVSVP